MRLTSQQVMRYLTLLASPDQDRITEQAWSVVHEVDELAWAGWAPNSAVAVENEPPASWYEAESTQAQASPPLDSFQAEPSPDEAEPPLYTPPQGLDSKVFRELAQRDELHREQSLGRVGWLFLTGTITVAGKTVPCCFPLFERRVKFVRVYEDYLPQWTGGLQRHSLLRRREHELVVDPVDRFLKGDFGSEPVDVARAAGLMLREFGIEVDAITDSTGNPMTYRGADQLILAPGTGFYLAHGSEFTATQSDLHDWSTRHISDTAFAKLYRTDDAALHPHVDDIGPTRSALPLNRRQNEAIDRLDTESVVAVSGPPGTGKTHTIVAAASDAVARGMSVLIATKTDFAAASTCELLELYPTPPYVRFGSETHRRSVAELLSGGSPAGVSDAQLAALTEAEKKSWDHGLALNADIIAALERKVRFEIARTDPALPAAPGAPRVLDGTVQDAVVQAQITKVEQATGRKHNRLTNDLRKMIGAPANADLAFMKQAITGAQAERDIAIAIDEANGDRLDDLWAKLDRAETDAMASQAIVDMARRSRPSPQALSSTAALATALRSSIETGALRLEDETSSAFLHHLPFWVGTLDEIEATLPSNPGMFDLVIFDEASQIDQPSAVPALCRAKRVLVVGDPKQLRHSSPITAPQIEAARIHAKIPDSDANMLLDIAANSLFDLAASATPITWLDEHFRSVPHLIQFSNDRWYGGHLRLMTQHPRNEGLDVIHPVRVHGNRSSAVNEHEIHAIVARLQMFLHQAVTSGTHHSVGVITPFTEQADAIEAAVLDAFSYDQIRTLGLRVGTVRGVQGTEREVMLVSLVFDERDFATALPLVEDPHHFNVMVTRARTQLELFHSFDPASLPHGILADYFHYEDHPPGLRAPATPTQDAWTTKLAAALELADQRVVRAYPVAGWTVDLVVGEGEAAFGVETTVHPDGPEAHRERHLTLRRAGWDLVSVFETSWLLKEQDAAIHLAAIAARRRAALAR